MLKNYHEVDDDDDGDRPLFGIDKHIFRNEKKIPKSIRIVILILFASQQTIQQFIFSSYIAISYKASHRSVIRT